MAPIIENNYVGDGTTVLYGFTFPYISEEDIYVSVDGSDTTQYTLANATTVEFDAAPTNGAAIRIYRNTSTDDIDNIFYPGSAIRAKDLNDNFTQSLYVIQEADITVDSANSNSAQAVADAAAAQTAAAQAATDASNAAASAAQAAADAANAAAVQVAITPVYNTPGDDQSGIKNLESAYPLDVKGGVTLPFKDQATWEANGSIRYNDASNRIEIYDDGTNPTGTPQWINAASGAQVSTTPPTPAVNGDVWYDPDSGRSYIYYVDVDSAQWVEMNPSWNGGVANGSITPAKLDRAYVELGTGGDVDLGTGDLSANSASFGNGGSIINGGLNTLSRIGYNDAISFFVNPLGGNTFTSVNYFNLAAETDNDSVAFRVAAYDGVGAFKTSKFMVAHSGTVKIGGALPQSPNIMLNATGDASVAGLLSTGAARLSLTKSGTGNRGQIYLNAETGLGASNDGIIFTSGGTTMSTITYGGSFGASDERLKTDLTPITDGLNKVSTLRCATGRYTFEPDDSPHSSFLIAQDVQNVLPEAVKENDEGNLMLNYSAMVPLLVSALHDAKARIEALEAEVQALKGGN